MSKAGSWRPSQLMRTPHEAQPKRTVQKGTGSIEIGAGKGQLRGGWLCSCCCHCWRLHCPQLASDLCRRVVSDYKARRSSGLLGDARGLLVWVVVSNRRAECVSCGCCVCAALVGRHRWRWHRLVQRPTATTTSRMTRTPSSIRRPWPRLTV
jgi:hypothetical protein